MSCEQASRLGDASRPVSAAGDAMDSSALEQRFRSETLKLHRWQVESRLTIEKQKSQLARYGERAKEEQAILTQLKNDVDDVSAETSALCAQTEEHQQALISEQSKRAMLLEGLDIVTEMFNSAEKKIDQVDMWKENVQKRLMNLRSHMMQLKLDATLCAEEKAKTEKALEALAKIRQELQARTDQVEELERLHSKALGQLQRERQAVDKAKAHNVDLQARAVTHQDEICQREAELASSKERLNKLKLSEDQLLENIRSQESMGIHQDECLLKLQQKQETEREDQKAVLEQLQCELNDAKDTVAKAEGKVALLDKAIASKKVELQSHEDECRKQKEHVSRLDDKIQHLEHELQTSQALRSKLEGLRAVDDEKAKLCEQLASEETLFRGEIAEVSEKLATLTSKQAELLAKIDDLEKDVAGLKDCEEELRSEVKQAANASAASKKAEPFFKSGKNTRAASKKGSGEPKKRKLIDSDDDELFSPVKASKNVITYSNNNNKSKSGGRFRFFRSKNTPEILE